MDTAAETTTTIMVRPFDVKAINEWLKSQMHLADGWVPFTNDVGFAIEPKTNWIIHSDACFSPTPLYWIDDRLQDAYVLEFRFRQHDATSGTMINKKGGGILISCERLLSMTLPEVSIDELIGNSIYNPRIKGNLLNVKKCIEMQFQLQNKVL